MRQCTLHSLLLFFGEHAVLPNLMRAILKEGTSIEKVPPLGRPVDKALVHFMDW